MQFERSRSREPRHGRGRLSLVWLTVLSLGAPVALLSAVTPASALSEIKREELPAPASPNTPTPPGTAAPTLGPAQPAAPGAAQEPGDEARPDVEDDGPPPEIIYNLDRLPEPVRRMHDKILEAAKTGNVEALQPLIGLGDSQTQLTFGTIEGDPIAFLKGLSGDSEGQEILAIMEEVLNAGFVHLDAGTPNELYVWPYFFAMSLEKLTPQQRVELFKIVTAGDFEDMKAFGTYIFYRVGIDPDGRWTFFVAGD